MSDPDRPKASKKLADALLENNLLSKAQIDLAIADQEMSDIPLEEILLVRGWITEANLYRVAPWLKPGSGQSAPQVKKGGASAKPADFSRAGGGASQTGQAKPSAKPADIPKEPPTHPTGKPLFKSPVESDRNQNLKAYKDVLRKILALDKDS
jgi:hypothetical protein